MSFITPRDGWEDPDVSRQPTVHPALVPHVPQPPTSSPAQLGQPVQYVYLPQPLPQPQFMSQTVVVHNQSSSGYLWLFVLFVPLLWPIALIIWLVNRSRSSVTVVNSLGYGAPQSQQPVTMSPWVIVAAFVLTIFAIAFIAVRNSNTTGGTNQPSAQPVASAREAFQRGFDKSFTRSCLTSFRRTTAYAFPATWADNYCSCALREYNDTGSMESARNVCVQELKESVSPAESAPVQ